MKKILLLLLALLATTSICAEDFINGVIVIGGTKSETNTLKSALVADGWILVDYDLNKGCGTGSDYIYLLYTKGSDQIGDAGYFLTDLYIRVSNSGNPPDEITHNGRTYYLVEFLGGSDFESSKGDLNNNAEGAYIHLYVATDDDENYRSTAVKSISFNNNSSGAVGENGGTTPCDLNKGCGTESEYIYMHTSTAQKGWTISASSDGTQCQITGYAGIKNNKTKMTIPNTIDGKTVMYCSDQIFSEFTSLDTLMMYNNCSLANMPSLQGCSSLKHVNNWISNNAYSYDQLPSPILRIPDYGFYGTAIEQLHTNSVTQIGEHAFEGCNLSLITVDKPNVVIRDYAFANLSSDECLIYSAGDLDNWSPKSYMYSYRMMVQSKDDLWYCGWCGGDETSNNHLYWTLKENHLKINCASSIWNDHPEKQIIIAHNWYSVLVQMPINTLTMNHVDTINQGVFKNVETLKLVDIKSGARCIEKQAFYGCDSLQAVYLPSTVKKIYNYVFYNCPLLTDIYFNGTRQQWDNVSKGSYWKPNATKVHWRCTVTFNANGHGTAPAAQTLWSDQDKATEPTPPTAEGYGFTGWYTDAQCTTPWNFDNVVSGDMTLYAGWMSGNGTEQNPYVISTSTDWDHFCDALQDNDTWNRFSGKFVKLGANISVTRMAGSSYHDFMGTFDGQGHMLTLAIGTAQNPISEDYVALFRNLETGANIHNLNVKGHIYTSQKFAGGIVGDQYGTVSLSNCRSSVIIHSSKEGDGTHGGIVAHQHGGALTMNGCVYNGRLLTTNGTTLCGGLVGYHSGGTCTISDCLYAPTADVTLAAGETYITNGATICRNYNGTPVNCYYTEKLGTAQGKQARSITAGENVTVAASGEGTVYDVSGITAYSTGIMYGGVLYAGVNDEMPLTLGYTGSDVLQGFTASAGTLAGTANPYTLTMPNADVVISAIATTAVLGDVDGDGAVTTVDVTCIYNYLLNGDTTFIDTCDVDGDGIITTTDITVIYNILLGN
ncbi:MAG: leucine-rich repeat protein [Muribaculaceae bacterium]|nr:leucine-rich repeat protein [Muribaculaceae bacterium]